MYGLAMTSARRWVDLLRTGLSASVAQRAAHHGPNSFELLPRLRTERRLEPGRFRRTRHHLDEDSHRHPYSRVPNGRMARKGSSMSNALADLLSIGMVEELTSALRSKSPTIMPTGAC